MGPKTSSHKSVRPAGGPRSAYAGLVEKQVFELGTPYVTVGGGTIKQVRVGYETIGHLNAAGDNAILVPHYFSGTSHFAGRYRPSDALPGYWDLIVGPGKPLDTDRYFLIGVDSLANVNALDGTTVTTGPASIDPDTGRPYGMRFPQVQIRDSVNVQKALLDRLGVKRLHAVMGASMGSMQGYEWAAVHPDLVDRLVAVVPCASVDAYTLARTRDLCAVIMLDPKWARGDYARTARPLKGLALALRILTLLSLAPPGVRYLRAPVGGPGEGPCLAHGPHLRHQYLYRLPRRGQCPDHRRQQPDLHGPGQRVVHGWRGANAGRRAQGDQGQGPADSGEERPAVPAGADPQGAGPPARPGQ
jgi:pimeloyl-ACP methyl ester carboxylesterase